MANKEINHELNQYDIIEGTEFTGLMPKVMEKVGLTTGEGEKSTKWFGFEAKGNDSLEVLDNEEIMNSSEGGDQGGDDEPIETQAEFDYIWNETTWNAAYAKAPLQAYYENHPEEDCWNTTANRACNYNDRLYVGKIDNESFNGKATWASDNAQKITFDNEEYYAPIFYGFEPQTVALYENVELTQSTGKEFVITTVCYSEDCPHCWLGAINAPGAIYPWCVVAIPESFNGTIKFVYDETNVVERTVESANVYYIESIPSLFGDEYQLDENGNTTFDESKLVVTLISE